MGPGKQANGRYDDKERCASRIVDFDTGAFRAGLPRRDLCVRSFSGGFSLCTPFIERPDSADVQPDRRFLPEIHYVNHFQGEIFDIFIRCSPS